MSILNAKGADETRYDVVSMGEVMLRLDPRDRRIRNTRSFDAWDSGAEYNVARAFRRAFGLRGALVSAFANNEIGALMEDLLLTSGLDLDFVNWVPYDGIGANVRNGLNFSERGYGVRGAVGCVDRANTAISQLKPEEVDWDELFVNRGTRLFHTGGIMAGLSRQAAETTEHAVRKAKEAGCVVSYDLNYRPSLWKAQGGLERCREANRAIVAAGVDVLVGNEEDFHTCLGITVEGIDPDLKEIDATVYEQLALKVAEEFPNLKAIGITLRTVHSANDNTWGAIAWAPGVGFAHSKMRPHTEIYDRLGGGDSFASGLLYGLLERDDLQYAVDLGAANGAVAMTTPGDTTTARLSELEAMLGGATARVVR